MKHNIDDSRIPDKQYFRIGEAAEIVGVEPYVLRFWETEFSELAPEKSKTNRRVYSRKTLATALTIRDLLYEHGYTIPGARKAMRAGKNAQLPVPERTKQVLSKAKSDLQELLALVR